MIYEKAMKLVAALRSGDYVQARDALHKIDGSRCCLGVACAVAGIEPIGQEDGRYVYSTNVDNDGRESAVLPSAVRKEFGFLDKNGTFRDNTRIPSRDPDDDESTGFSCLTELNDEGFTFAEIADIIEKEWENL